MFKAPQRLKLNSKTVPKAIPIAPSDRLRATQIVTLTMIEFYNTRHTKLPGTSSSLGTLRHNPNPLNNSSNDAGEVVESPASSTSVNGRLVPETAFMSLL